MAESRHALGVEASIPDQLMGDGDAAKANGLPTKNRLADDKQRFSVGHGPIRILFQINAPIMAWY
jgi:hypothetical protein